MGVTLLGTVVLNRSLPTHTTVSKVSLVAVKSAMYIKQLTTQAVDIKHGCLYTYICNIQIILRMSKGVLTKVKKTHSNLVSYLMV